MDNIEKYEDFLSRMQGLLDNAKKQGHIIVRIEDLENTFPELKESEDERIRKEIIEMLRNWASVHYITKKQFSERMTWLEKRGEPNPYSGVSFNYNGHTWSMCARDNGVEILVGGEIKERVFLDNKPRGKSALESIKEKKVDNANKIEPKDYSSIDLYFGKPIDNVKPNFHEGNWITNANGEYTWKVISVDDLDYTLQNQCGECIYDTVDYVNKAFHLWTIQDAKDGDVIWHSDSANNGIFIFKEIRHDGKVLCYCDYDSEDHFCTGEYHTCCWSQDKYIKPATKEQCNLLFQKMKEAGYEWDADNKELNKEEVKMTRKEQINLYLKERNIPITSLEANSIIEGIKWADEHPNKDLKKLIRKAESYDKLVSKGLVSIEKVCAYLEMRLDEYIIKDLKKAMEE